jgi:arsenate reductase (thioredoxin)
MLHKPPHHVLFVCTGNSARSIIAESVLRHLGAPRMVAHSAGSHPKGQVHPLALETLTRMRLPTERLHSKSWDEFARADAPALDFVITVCDNAAGEVCPVWPGQPISAHWGLPDPAAAVGDEAHQRQAFVDTVVALRRRIELMLALPMERLDMLALQRGLRAIGEPSGMGDPAPGTA